MPELLPLHPPHRDNPPRYPTPVFIPSYCHLYNLYRSFTFFVPSIHRFDPLYYTISTVLTPPLGNPIDLRNDVLLRKTVLLLYEILV